MKISSHLILFIQIHFALTEGLQYGTTCKEDPDRDKHFEGNLRQLKQSGPKLFHYPTPQPPGSKLYLLCYDGQPRRKLQLLWTSIRLRLDIGDDASYSVYHGQNISQVVCQHHEALSSWLSLLPWKTHSIPLATFNRTCVGIYTAAPFSLHFQVKEMDYWIILWLLIGLILFICAQSLSRNVLFYYTTGISFGLLASILIAVLVLSRLVPKRAGGYVVLLGGWSVTLYLLQCLWDNVHWLMEKYSLYVGIYFLSVGLISFGVLYYKGPVSSPRALDLIKWTLQLIGLFFIYNGTQIIEVSAAIIFVLILQKVWPRRITQAFKCLWLRVFPPRTRLLTAEEYESQGEKATKEALANLRAYCRSPNCDAWRTLSHLHSPHRFAQWVEGESLHLTDEEVLQYDSDPCPHLPFDNESEEEMDFTLGSQ